MSSHWGFFPTTKEGLGDRFVDVTEREDIKFDSDKSGIGKKAEYQGKVDGEIARPFPFSSSIMGKLIFFCLLPHER
jgi:hypothetical protein